jgi:lipopolysaccharide/colanic/teichoic acid biosynthesis glycosyltransferase
MSRLCEILLVVLAAPVWLALAGVTVLLIWCVDGGPLFFRQERAGKDGRPFRMWKFRTMRDGAGSDGERLTRLGRFLRATSLDELPELIHVLTGTMALVGPRPLPVRYLPRYSPEQARRHAVRPGITGGAQVNGRNLLDWETKFAYDVWYVDHRSWKLDAKILFLTVKAVLTSRGVAAQGDVTMAEFTGGMKNGA